MSSYINCIEQNFLCTLEIVGTNEQIDNIRNFFKSSDSMIIDFNNIIKMPENLESCNNYSQEFSKSNECVNWCMENWDCERNAEDQELSGNNMISFHLFNGPAVSVILKLSERFPEVIFAYDIYRRCLNDALLIIEKGEIKRFYIYDELMYTGINEGQFYTQSSKLEMDLVRFNR